MTDMTLNLAWGQITWGMGIVFAWSAFLIGIITGLVAKIVSNFEKKITDDNSQLKARVELVDLEYRKLLVELPMQYQRREDTIRDQTVINGKLDKLYELILETKNNA